MIYTVEKGDTWSIIAEKMTTKGGGYNDELAKFNNMTTMQQLSVGQKLIIPDSVAKKPTFFNNKMVWFGIAAIAGAYYYMNRKGK